MLRTTLHLHTAFRIVPADSGVTNCVNADSVSGPHAQASNCWDTPDLGTIRPLDPCVIRDGTVLMQLPPLTVAAATFGLG